MTHPLAQTYHSAGTWTDATDHCELSYDARFLRRKVITTAAGQSVLVDLPKTTSLAHGDALETDGGALIEIRAAEETLLRITGDNLVQLAWHIGNRHTPCQIEDGQLLIQDDQVIAHMLLHLGATVTRVARPFTPEGGAYGHGRTQSHSHGATAHEHSHTHSHSHSHAHSHSHGSGQGHVHSHDHADDTAR